MAGPIRIAILANAAQARREIKQFTNDLGDIKKHLGSIDRLGQSVAGYTRGASKATAITTGLTSAIATAGAASSPLLALGGGIASAMGAASLGVGAFVALAIPSFKSVAEATSAVTKAQEQYDAAVAAGDDKAATKALEARTAALKNLTPVQRQAVLATLDMKDAFGKASEKFADPAIRTYTKGVETLKNLIPTLIKVATPVQSVVTDQFDRLFESLESPAFDKFAGRLATYVGPIIKTTSDIAADLGMTIGHVIDAALPVANQMLSIFGSLFSELREASASSGLAEFFKNLVPLASKLADFISALVKAVGYLIKATIPLAGPLLTLLENLSNSLGKLFKSAQFSSLVGSLGKAFEALSPVLDILLQAIGSVAAIIGKQLGPVITNLTPFVSLFAKTFTQILEGVAPLLPVVAELISSLGAALLPVLGQLLPAIAEALLPVIKQLAEEVLPEVAPHFQTIVDAVIPLLPLVADLIAQVLPLIPVVVETVAAILEFSTASGEAQNTIKTLGQIVAGAVKIIDGALKIVVGLLKGDWGTAWQGAQKIVEGVMQAAGSAVEGAMKGRILGPITGGMPKVKSVWSAGWNAAKTLLAAAWSAIVSTVTTKAGSVITKVRDLKSKVTGVFNSAGTWLLAAGRHIIDGLVDGIRDAKHRVQEILSDITDLIPDWKGPASRDSKLLYGAGRLIIQSLVDGFNAGKSAVRQELQSVTSMIQASVNPVIAPRVSLAGVHGDLSGYGTTGRTNVYRIDVTAPVGSSSADIGRELVKHIESFESAGGRRRSA